MSERSDENQERAERRRRNRERLEAMGLGELGQLGELGDFGDLLSEGNKPSRRELLSRIEELEAKVAKQGERIIVLERIAVQDEARISAEIEQLRGARGNG